MRQMNDVEIHIKKDVDVVAGLIGRRNSSNPSGLSAARDYIKLRIAESGMTAVEQRYKVPGREAVNLEVILPGTKLQKPCLIVGAHYDSAGDTPGADDNASAVAALLQIIRELASRRHRRSIRCVFYDCEEPPHFATQQMGSFQHAKLLKESGVKVHGMICLESIGYFPKRVEPRVWRPGIVRWLDTLIGGRYVAIVSDVRSIPFGLPFVLRFATAGFFKFVPAAMPDSVDIHKLSDHWNYWKHGYRAVMVTNTAMFRNPNYHLPSDLPGTLDFPRLAQLTRMLSRVVRRTCA
jgi:hypothetical protein